MKRAATLSAVLLLATLACGLPNISVDWPTEAPEEIEILGTPGELTGTVSLPAGLLVDTFDEYGLTFYNLDGQLLGELAAPGAANNGTESVHVAGRMPSGTPNAPLIYHTFDENGAIRMNNNGQVTVLAYNPNIASLRGAPGEPLLAYSTIEYNQNGVSARMFAGNAFNLAAAPVVFSNPGSESKAIIPLAVETAGGSISGIWFTYRPWGIGGDIVFDPTSELLHLDTASGLVTVALGADANRISLSPDRTWAAYTPEDGGPGTLTVQNLGTGQTASFALLPDSDRGAGNAVFSPDSLHVAWFEGHGWLMAEVPDFQPTLRIGGSDGNILFNLPAASLTNAAGFSVSYINPAGWADNQTLLVEARGDSWEQAAILKVTLQGDIRYLCPGAFAGFFYP